MSEFLESRYDAFLSAPLCKGDKAFSVLSVFARQGLDPKQEAARLTELPQEQAINSLASRIWRSNSERWSPSQASIIAMRLIVLLPSHGESRSRARSAEGRHSAITLWLVIGALLGSIIISGNNMREFVKRSSLPSQHVSVALQHQAQPQMPDKIARN